MQQNQLQTAQSKVDAEGRVRQAEAELAAAEADLAQQQASYQIAAFDRDAYTRLAETGAASERQAKQAIATADQQAAAVDATRRRVEAARGALTTARANLENPDIREAQVAMVRKQIILQRSEVASAEAITEQARGQLREAQANRQDLVVLAPFSGVVVTRAAEPGEVVTAGTALVTMVDLGKVYLRGFVPEGQIGKVKLGQPAHVYLDSNTKQPIDASVSRIDPQATFTPENTYFQDERVKQVVGVKLQLKGAIGFAKPGMPADGEILTQGNTWPEASRKMTVTSRDPGQPALEALRRRGSGSRHRPGRRRWRDLRLDRARRSRQDLDVPDSGRGHGAQQWRCGNSWPACARRAVANRLPDPGVQSLSGSHGSREHPLHRRPAPRGSPRDRRARQTVFADVRHGPLLGSVGRQIERRDEAEAGAHLCAGATTARVVAGRADDRRRPGLAARILGHARSPGSRRIDDSCRDAVHG